MKVQINLPNWKYQVEHLSNFSINKFQIEDVVIDRFNSDIKSKIKTRH